MLANVIKMGMTKILMPTEASIASRRFIEIINSRNIHQVTPKTNIQINDILNIWIINIALVVLCVSSIVYSF